MYYIVWLFFYYLVSANIRIIIRKYVIVSKKIARVDDGHQAIVKIRG